MANPVRILLVDPNDAVAATCREMFASRGWHVDHARTFEEAMALAAKSVYHVAIIEVMLPDAIGAEAWAHLKKLHPQMCGIYMTWSPSLHSSLDATQPDILAYFLKPLHLDVLCNNIARAVAAVPDKSL